MSMIDKTKRELLDAEFDRLMAREPDAFEPLRDVSKPRKQTLDEAFEEMLVELEKDEASDHMRPRFVPRIVR